MTKTPLSDSRLLELNPDFCQWVHKEGHPKAGQQCGLRPAKGRKWCKKHRGAVPVGVNAPAFKHGRFSKYMPAQVAERFQEALHDPDLADYMRDVALIDSFIVDKLQQLEKGPAPLETIRKCREIFNAINTVLTTPNSNIDRIPTLVQEGIAITNPALRRALVVEEIESKIERRRRLLDSKNNAEYKTANIVTVAELLVFMNRVIDLVQTTVNDEKERYALLADIQRLIVEEPR